MNMTDNLVLGAILLAVVLITAWIIRRKKQGSGGCGCCAYRGKCTGKPCG